MSRYLLRRLLIAVPSLLGISIILYTVLALAPGDPFVELATNPNVPAELGGTGWRWYWEEVRQAIMPVAVLGLFQGASWTRYVRSAVLDVIRLDHVTTARSKGLSEHVVVIKHVVRNALIPVVTLVAL